MLRKNAREQAKPPHCSANKQPRKSFDRQTPQSFVSLKSPMKILQLFRQGRDPSYGTNQQ